MRLGGVSSGRETQGWRDSSHTAMFGAGKLGSAKLPMGTLTYPGKPVFSQLSFSKILSGLWAFANFVVDLFKSRRRLEAENLLLRHQLNVALRYAPRRLRLRGVDRAVLVGLARFWPPRTASRIHPDMIFGKDRNALIIW